MQEGQCSRSRSPSSDTSYAQLSIAGAPLTNRVGSATSPTLRRSHQTPEASLRPSVASRSWLLSGPPRYALSLACQCFSTQLSGAVTPAAARRGTQRVAPHPQGSRRLSSRPRRSGYIKYDSTLRSPALISAVTAMPGIRRKLRGTLRRSAEVTSTRAL